MNNVTVIGLGEMGSALADAFLGAGDQVKVWNRTAAKAAPLQVRGVALASNIEDALNASPIIVICVSSYEAAHEILADERAVAALNGRIVVQLTTGIPKQARALEAHITAAGGRYLDGAIAAWPRQIGTSEASILVSGATADFAEAQSALGHLGELTHMGEDIGSALMLFNAALSYLAGHWIGFSYGAVICEAGGLSVETFGDIVASFTPALADDMRHMARAISRDSYVRPESTLRTAGTDIGRLVELSRDLSIGPAWPSFAASTFQRAMDAGFGEDEHCAIAKTMRSH